MPTSNFQPVRLLNLDCYYKFAYLIANSADPDQFASLLFARAGYIRVQQDNG